MTIESRQMQWSVLTEGKRKNELANKTEVRFEKTTIIIRGGVITFGPSPLYQRCTAAKDGQLQGDHGQQTKSVGCFD